MGNIALLALEGYSRVQDKGLRKKRRKKRKADGAEKARS